MGDLGLPGSVVALSEAGEQRNLWEVRKAGLNIMMSLKGDGKPVSFIEDCAVPLEHLAEYTDALTRGVRETRNSRYLVCPCLRRHAARAADSRHAPGRSRRRRPQNAGHRRGSRGAGAQIPRRLQRRARRWPVPRRVDRVAVRIVALRSLSGHQAASSIRSGCSIPARSSIRRKMDDAALFRFAPPSAPRPYRTLALDAGARLVGLERAATIR